MQFSHVLEIGLSGIAEKYGYQNVQEFYHTYHLPIVPVWIIRDKRLNGKKLMNLGRKAILSMRKNKNITKIQRTNKQSEKQHNEKIKGQDQSKLSLS